MDQVQSIHLNYYYQLLPRGKTTIPNNKVIEFFRTSLLPAPILGRIWQQVNPQSLDAFDVSMFTEACNLIALSQQNPQPSVISSRAKATLPARFELLVQGQTLEPVALSSSSTGLKDQQQLQQHSMPIGMNKSRSMETMCQDHPAIPNVTEHERYKYSQAFYSLNPSNGFLDGVSIKDFFIQSGLSMDQLKSLWFLCDTDRDGRLSLDDFAIMMHLAMMLEKKILPSAPPSLPPSFMSQYRLLQVSDDFKIPSNSAFSYPNAILNVNQGPGHSFTPVINPIPNIPIQQQQQQQGLVKSFSANSLSGSRKSSLTLTTERELEFVNSDIQKVTMKIGLLQKELLEQETRFRENEEDEKRRHSSANQLKLFDEECARIRKVLIERQVLLDDYLNFLSLLQI